VSAEPEAKPPLVLQQRSTDEYLPPPLTPAAAEARDRVADEGEDRSRQVGLELGSYWASRLGTAAGLQALNDASGCSYYDVPDEASDDFAAANEAFAGTGPVIDVQTHFIADARHMDEAAGALIRSYRDRAPDWWTGLDGIVGYSLAEFLRCVYVESEVIAAVLTAPPADERGDRFLDNLELAGTRELIDRMAGTGRLFNHAVVQPNLPGELDRMAEWHDKLHPVGWKVYTAGVILGERGPGRAIPESDRWMLDDEEVGMPFLARARDLGSKVICSHKGLSRDVDNGSPRDIGPCAKAFPELQFIVYHSGFEPELTEGPYTDQTAHDGTNRLIKTLYDNNIPRGGNVSAELGTTWFCLIKRPEEAAHLLGKLLVHLGADNVIWGTDSIWYGPSQPVIDAFRSFQIPEWMQEEFGYPALTAEIKDKILCRNAARIYGFDVDALLGTKRNDAIGWTRQAALEAEAHGLPSHALDQA
jgi:uncharacterized protein